MTTADEEPLLPAVSEDDSDDGWSEGPLDGQRDDGFYLRERPPHHGD